VGLTVLDASVLIGLLDATDAHHEAAVAATRERLAASDQMVVPASAYAELLVGPIRRGKDAVAIVDAFVAALPAAIVPLGPGVARAAAALRAANPGRLRLPDAFVLGTAIELGADRVITADRRWPRVEGISVQLLDWGASDGN
jgi:predicted nucleic acid-binding protein